MMLKTSRFIWKTSKVIIRMMSLLLGC